MSDFVPAGPISQLGARPTIAGQKIFSRIFVSDLVENCGWDCGCEPSSWARLRRSAINWPNSALSLATWSRALFFFELTQCIGTIFVESAIAA
jgi:hypothetical protein